MLARCQLAANTNNNEHWASAGAKDKAYYSPDGDIYRSLVAAKAAGFEDMLALVLVVPVQALALVPALALALVLALPLAPALVLVLARVLVLVLVVLALALVQC